MRRILIAMGMALACRQAAACSCLVTEPDRQIQDADVVFIGRVTSIDPAPRPAFVPGQAMNRALFEWGPGNGVHVSFEIATAIKGTTDRVISLWTGYGGGDCGIEFNPALTYFVLARYDDRGTLTAALCGGSAWLGYRSERTRFAWLLDDFAFSDPEPYDVRMVTPPVLIGARVPALSQMDNFPVLLEIDREGRVTHFSFADGLDRCTACCAEKRASLARNVTLWRFQPAMLDGNPVATRIRTLSRLSVPTTDDQLRYEQFRLKWEQEKFDQKRSP